MAPITPHAAATHGLILEVGTLAYLDTFAGLVPCKVQSLTETVATVRVTATRGAYRRGEVGTWPIGLVVIPRRMVCRSRGLVVLSGVIVPIPG